MALDHEAIYEAYKSEAKPVVSIDDSAGAFDADGASVTLDDAKVAAARTALDTAAAAIAYKSQRTGADGTTDTDTVMEDVLQLRPDEVKEYALHLRLDKVKEDVLHLR